MLPYFDALFTNLKQEDKPTQEAFGEFVHWGYWDNPATDNVTPEEFYQAAVLMLTHTIKTADLKPGSKILDVGSGMGGTIKYLNNRCTNCELVGVNIDDRQIAHAQGTITPGNGNTIEFVKSDASDLPFPDQKFDIIVCVESIFHFGDREKFFKGIRRVLKPGGRFIVSDFVPVHVLSTFMDVGQRKLNLISKAYGDVDISGSIPKYKKIAQASGFVLESVEDITPNTLPTYRFLKQNLSLSQQEQDFRSATAVIGFVSRLNLLQYLVMSFK